MGREASLSEVVWLDLGFCYTYYTVDFVHTATLPLENHVGVMMTDKTSKFVKEMETGILLPVHERVVANLLTWRKYTDSQIKHIEDYCSSPSILDAASGFNIRPPELLSVLLLLNHSVVL